MRFHLADEIFGAQPSDFTFETSRTLRGVPSGFEESQAISPWNPANSATNSASSLDCEVFASSDIQVLS
jgi:hypothetical protein